MTKKIALITLLVILLLVNWSIYSKEVHLKEGKTVYLALAPVDPRSLMQGDYMALRFTLASDIYKALPKVHTPHRRDSISYADGDVVVNLDKEHKGTFKALYNNQTLQSDEIRLHYRVRNNKVKLASNAFFFQEGDAKVYEKAKYGEFKVKDGALLLANMYDEKLQLLGKNISK